MNSDPGHEAEPLPQPHYPSSNLLGGIKQFPASNMIGKFNNCIVEVTLYEQNLFLTD
jgi:hypothetical protein